MPISRPERLIIHDPLKPVTVRGHWTGRRSRNAPVDASAHSADPAPLATYYEDAPEADTEEAETIPDRKPGAFVGVTENDLKLSLYVDLEKAKKPYGHVAYNREDSRTGKIIHVKQRGIKITTPGTDLTFGSGALSGFKGKAEDEIEEGLETVEIQKVDWRKNKLTAVLGWEMELQSPENLPDADREVFAELSSGAGGKITVATLREKVKEWLIRNTDEPSTEEEIDTTMRALINEWLEAGAVYLEMHTPEKEDFDTLLFANAGFDFYGIEFSSTIVAPMDQDSPTALGWRSSYTGEIRLRQGIFATLKSAIERRKAEKGPITVTHEESEHLSTLLHEMLHGAGTWKEPAANLSVSSKEYKNRSWDHYRYGHGRALQEGAVELLAQLDAPEFFGRLGFKGVKPGVDYTPGNISWSTSYPTFVRAVEALVEIAATGEFPSARVPMVNTEKKKKILRDLTYLWKPTTRARKLAELMCAHSFIEDGPKARERRIKLVESKIIEHLESTSYSGFGRPVEGLNELPKLIHGAFNGADFDRMTLEATQHSRALAFNNARTRHLIDLLDAYPTPETHVERPWQMGTAIANDMNIGPSIRKPSRPMYEAMVNFVTEMQGHWNEDYKASQRRGVPPAMTWDAHKSCLLGWAARHWNTADEIIEEHKKWRENLGIKTRRVTAWHKQANKFYEAEKKREQANGGGES